MPQANAVAPAPNQLSTLPAETATSIPTALKRHHRRRHVRLPTYHAVGLGRPSDNG